MKLTDRLEKLRNLMGDNEAVFISSYPNIFYYSGFRSEDAYLLITHEWQYIITDSRYTIQAAQQAKDFELLDIKNTLGEALKKACGKTIGFEEENISVSMYERLKKVCPEGTELVPMQNIISKPRRTKDENEIGKIAEAERLGDAAFSYILGKIKRGMTEREIALELEFFMKKNGASALSFDTIAASGVRGAMPHGLASDKVIEDKELLTLDFGCVLDGYCSDMTRTVAIGGVCPELREIYDIVLRAQTAAINAVKAGIECCEIDKIARDIIKQSGYGECFGHGLGHSVGIEIHEAPSFSPKCRDLTENGNVITVEPGIYVEGLGGVRIEDVVAIVDGEAHNLTRSEKALIIL